MAGEKLNCQYEPLYTKITAFWNMQCTMADIYRCFTGISNTTKLQGFTTKTVSFVMYPKSTYSELK